MSGWGVVGGWGICRGKKREGSGGGEGEAGLSKKRRQFRVQLHTADHTLLFYASEHCGQ